MNVIRRHKHFCRYQHLPQRLGRLYFRSATYALLLSVFVVTCYTRSSSPLESYHSRPSQGYQSVHANGHVYPRIAITIGVRNRIVYVRLLSENLNFLHVEKHGEIFVFDNGSTEFNNSDLKRWFPTATVIALNCQHDPDIVTRKAFEFFLRNLTHDVVVNIDSDALLHPSWFKFMKDTLPLSDGILSLYHSAAPYHKSFDCDEKTCRKNTTGALGLVMTRTVLSQALEVVNNSKTRQADSFDWALCKHFTDGGFRILVPRKSLLLHYGLHGAHGHGVTHVEEAVDFEIQSLPTPMQSEVKFYLNGKFAD